MKAKVEMMQSTAILDKPLDLERLAFQLEGSVYEPRKFPGIRYKPIGGDSLTFLIYQNGKLVITGGKTKSQLKNALDEFAQLVEAGVKEFKVHCVVGTINLGKQLRLNVLSEVFEEAEYNPENFPGVVFRSKCIIPRFLIFKTGKVVIAGARTITELQDAANKLGELLRGHQEVYSESNQ